MKKFYFVLMAAVFFAACRTPRFAYAQSAVNVPVLTKKGDSKIGALYSSNGSGTRTGTALDVLLTDGKSRGLDAQAAYALTDKFAIQASYFHRYDRNGNPGVDTSTQPGALIKYKRDLFEIGVGYYAPMGDSKTNFFQVFGCVGFGKFKINEHGNDSTGRYNRFHYSNVSKFYIQPAIILGATDLIHFTFSSRFSLVKYNSIKNSYIKNELDDYNLSGLAGNSFVFWEPAITNSYEFRGLPGVKFEWQFGKSFRLNKTYLDMKTFNISIGAFLDLPKLFSKRSD